MKKNKTLLEREMERASFRKKYMEQKETLKLELQILQELEKKQMTYEALAKLIGTKKSNISRDLKGGGLRTASLVRIEEMAKALDCDFLPLFLPKNKKQRNQRISLLLEPA